MSHIIGIKGENINANIWADGRYYPTPTIIEAAMSLYGGHTVEEIARTDASAVNLSVTTDAILKIITNAKATSKKPYVLLPACRGPEKHWSV